MRRLRLSSDSLNWYCGSRRSPSSTCRVLDMPTKAPKHYLSNLIVRRRNWFGFSCCHEYNLYLFVPIFLLKEIVVHNFPCAALCSNRTPRILEWQVCVKNGIGLSRVIEVLKNVPFEAPYFLDDWPVRIVERISLSTRPSVNIAVTKWRSIALMHGMRHCGVFQSFVKYI